jgi:hypothetical protein
MVPPGNFKALIILTVCFKLKELLKLIEKIPGSIVPYLL